MAQLWSPEEEEFLRENIEAMSRPELAQALQRTEQSIQNKAQKMRLKNKETGIKTKRLFNEEQEQEIIKAYLEGDAASALGKRYGSEKAVRNVLKRAGIKRSDRKQKQKWLIDESLHKQIEEEYLQGETINSLATKYGVSDPTLRRVLTNRSIRLRNASEVRRTLTDDQIKEAIYLYESGAKNQTELANEFGVSKMVIWKSFNTFNAKKREGSYVFNEERQREIVEKYSSGNEDTTTLSKQFNTSVAAIRNVLRHHDIELRSIKEARILASERDIDVQQIIDRYKRGESTILISQDYAKSDQGIRNLLLRHGVEIRQREGGDTIDQALNNTVNFVAPRETFYYVYTVKDFPTLLKPGISFSSKDRAEDPWYDKNLLEITYPTRHEAFFLEEAVLKETRKRWFAPDSFVEMNWGGISELREMDFDELEEVIIYYQNKLLEMEPWLFAAEYVPMTDIQREECLQKAGRHLI